MRSFSSTLRPAEFAILAEIIEYRDRMDIGARTKFAIEEREIIRAGDLFKNVRCYLIAHITSSRRRLSLLLLCNSLLIGLSLVIFNDVSLDLAYREKRFKS